MQTAKSTAVTQKKTNFLPVDVKKQAKTDPRAKSKEETMKERKDQQDVESKERGTAHVSGAPNERTADGEAGYKGNSDGPSKGTDSVSGASPTTKQKH
ncbi:MAG: hypothetical protein NTV34_04850 [Proteobacteria bacterium]|nr:hypothetical protein [Pseudomonadota bacterium]